MKKFIIGLLSLIPVSSFAASTVPNQMYPGECIFSFSANGEWMVSELDVEHSLLIRNLTTGQQWTYFTDGLDNGVDYALGMSTCVSNDGTVVAEVSNVPSYWKNGKWKPLPEAAGVRAAIIGGITPDGSAIVGSVSRGSSMMTQPCIWYRQENGTYGNPEWLPVPRSGAQYINATCISDDARVVGVSLRSGSGFSNPPYAYVRNDDGSWTYKDLGGPVLNPPGRVLPTSPGSYRGPQAPNYESYMTEEQIEAYYEATGYAWLNELYDKGMSEDEMYVEGILYAAEFMNEDKRARYEPLARSFANAYLPWAKAMAEYLEALAKIEEDVADFEFNNVYMSPDGKYIYATAYRVILVDPGNPEYGQVKEHAPVRFDVATGEYTVYPFDYDAIITCVTGDYSVLGWDYDMDLHLYRPAYIFPEGSTEGFEIQDYWKQLDNSYAYTWLEENLYREVLVAITPTGGYLWDDAWSIGKPVATPDMSLWGYGGSTLYWSALPAENAMFITYIFNPDESASKVPDDGKGDEEIEDSGITGVDDNAGIGVRALADGVLEISGEVSGITVCDLSGKTVFTASSPAATVSTGLDRGLYIVNAVSPSGTSLTRKVRF